MRYRASLYLTEAPHYVSVLVSYDLEDEPDDDMVRAAKLAEMICDEQFNMMVFRYSDSDGVIVVRSDTISAFSFMPLEGEEEE